MKVKVYLRCIIEAVFVVATGSILAALFCFYIGFFVMVQGISMNPTIADGEMMYACRFAYHIDEPERFDIAIIESGYDEHTYLCKRVIGLPGEVVRIDEDGVIYINGRVLEEEYDLDMIENPGMASERIYLDEDEYFVLGDNRNNSLDSRFEPVGIIEREQFFAKGIQIFK